MVGLLDNWGMGIGNWFSGQDMTGQSQLYLPEDYARARGELLGGLGATLLAAGQPMSGAQRAQILAGIPQVTAGYQKSLRGGLEDRMMGEKLKGWKDFRSAAERGELGELPESLQQIIRYADPETGMKIAADWLSRGPADPVNWQEVTTADGVFLYNPQTQEMKKVGERAPQPGEGGFDDKAKLRGEYLKQAQPFVETSTAYQRVLGASKDQTGASDIALVYGFMKMLDPTSAVREGEYATAENAGGIPSQVVSAYNRMLTGERLTPDIRQQFLQQAGRQYQEQYSSYTQIRDQYSGLAQQFGFDPNEIAIDLTRGVQMPQQQQQQFGDEEVDKIPEGAVVRNEKGQRFRKQNGKLVPVQ